MTENRFSLQEDIPIKLYSDEVNFGDILGLTISQKLAPNYNYKVIQPYEDCDQLNFVSIGSILKGADANSLVWGSGFIAPDEYLHSKPKAVYAVRGPLTNKKIQQQGLAAAKVLGDPAYLIKFFFDYNVKTQFKYGILPHYLDKKDPRVIEASEKDDVLIIDPQQDPENVIDKIKSCQYILSSSLHGLICADVFNIPVIYMKLSDKLAGGQFKFLDYFLSCGRQDHAPYIVEKHIDFNKALNKIENFKNKINIDDLRDSCPLLQ